MAAAVGTGETKTSSLGGGGGGGELSLTSASFLSFFLGSASKSSQPPGTPTLLFTGGASVGVIAYGPVSLAGLAMIQTTKKMPATTIRREPTTPPMIKVSASGEIREAALSRRRAGRSSSSKSSSKRRRRLERGSSSGSGRARRRGKSSTSSTAGRGRCGGISRATGKLEWVSGPAATNTVSHFLQRARLPSWSSGTL